MQVTSLSAVSQPLPSDPSTSPVHASPSASRQVYLLEPEAGTVCRILALYAARGLPLEQVRLDRAAPQTLMLVVHSRASPPCLRVLVEKAATLHGVIEAALD